MRLRDITLLFAMAMAALYVPYVYGRVSMQEELKNYYVIKVTDRRM